MFSIRLGLCVTFVVSITGPHPVAALTGETGSHPWRPGPAANRSVTVVIVCGSSQERTVWSRSARTHFGPSAYIYNSPTNIYQIGRLLTLQFPPGSISRLVIGAHGNSAGANLGGEWLNAGRLKANTGAMKSIRSTLKANALVDLQYCNAAQQSVGQDNLGSVAGLLRRRVRAPRGFVGPWDDRTAHWVIISPPVLRTLPPTKPPVKSPLVLDPLSPVPERPTPGGIGLLGLNGPASPLGPSVANATGKKIPPVKFPMPEDKKLPRPDDKKFPVPDDKHW
jgi:hypothetical protein